MDPRLKAFERLLNIMDDLREKCPWDKKQTLDTLRTLTIEETYELCDAIINKDLSALEGEIGDLFLHLVFYCKIGQEKEAFDVASVLNKICEKLIHRHPHVYGDVSVASEEEVKANWEKLKLKEGKKLWALSLKNESPEVIIEAVEKVISSQSFLPTLTDIMKSCNEINKIDGFPSAQEAYIEARKSYQPRKDFDWSNPIVYFAGKKFGWNSLNERDSNENFNAFRKIFDSLKTEFRKAKISINPKCTNKC